MLITLLLAIISLSLFTLLYLRKGRNFSLALFFISFALIIFYLYKIYPAKGTFTLSGFERNQLIMRGNFYNLEMGEIYGRKVGFFYFNKVKFPVDRIFRKISEPFDLVRYFSFKQTSIYPYFLLPFFAIGFIHVLINLRKPLLLYLSVAILVAIGVSVDKTVLLFIPLINVSIVRGVIESLKLLKRAGIRK